MTTKKPTGQVAPPEVDDLKAFADRLAAQEPADDAEVVGRYDDRVKEANQELRRLAETSERLTWKHAIVVYYTIQSLQRDYGENVTLERMYDDLARGHKWGPARIKKAKLYVNKLYDMGREEVVVRPFSGFDQMISILSSKLPEELKDELVVKVYKHDKANPDRPFSVQAVQAMVKDLMPEKEKEQKWLQGTDMWSFGDHDPRYGSSGHSGRLPGQIFLNLIHRFATGAGLRVLSIGCGSGTIFDVCAKDMARIVSQVRGVDLFISESLRDRHPDQEYVAGPNGLTDQQGVRAIEFDATLPADMWDDYVCPPEWADMAIVTLDFFSFTSTVTKDKATTVEPTNFGNINDPEQYVAALQKVIGNAFTRLTTGGVIAVLVRQTSEFEEGTPVPDIEFAALQAIHANTDLFLSSPTIRVNTMTPKPVEPHDRYLNPEAMRLLIYRKV